MIEVISVPLNVGGDAVRGLEMMLSGAERRRAARFVHDRDRHRYVVARARLRELLAARLDAQPESIEFSYGAYGKPAIAPGFTELDLRFNLSHSDDLAVYAFAYGREIGVDVEAVRTPRDADGIAERFFSPREYRAYLALHLRDRPLGFFNCWTRKEAYIKAIGEGLTHPLDRFDVSLAPDEPARILRVSSTPGDEREWHMEAFFPATGFVAAIVIEN